MRTYWRPAGKGQGRYVAGIVRQSFTLPVSWAIVSRVPFQSLPGTHALRFLSPIPAARSGALNVAVRELLGHYMSLEEMYMYETAGIAIRIDEVRHSRPAAL